MAQSRVYARAERSPMSGGVVATAGMGVNRGGTAGLAASGADPDAVTATTPNNRTQRIARTRRTATYVTAGTVPTQRNAVSSNLYSASATAFNDRSCEAGKERQTTTLLAADDVRRAITRIAHEIVERDRDLSLLAIVGIRARGDALAARIQSAIRANEGVDVPLGAIDITLYRDDLTRIGYAPVVRESEIPFSVDGRVVVLVDDVLFTGRTIRAAMDALVDYGRPRAIRLAVLVDRGHRELPIRADFVGRNVPTAPGDDVRVHLAEVDGRDEVEVVARVPA
jgi:pyrimidine operon attenuation protein/uracil phosphoribosyltransferase